MIDKSRSSGETAALVQRIGYAPMGLVVGIVLLRLAIGWHFYREGTSKLAYNPVTGKTRVEFAGLEPFLRAAVGPLAEHVQADLPNVHEWQRLLVVPRMAPMTADEAAQRDRWNAEYARRRREAESAGKTPPAEFRPEAPYAEWAERIEADWRELVEQFRKVDALSPEQQEAATKALDARRLQLADYLASQENSFLDWQHELWRLGQWQAAPDASSLPFQSERIAEKRTETEAASGGWVAEVRALEQGLQNDLRGMLTAEQRNDPEIVAEVNSALGDAKEQKLQRTKVIVTSVVIGVGVCLLLGLFTRPAALTGIGFLVMVMATQPPWVAGARTDFFYYQLVEVAALVVLFAAAAGRWAGLDFFLRALWSRCCGPTEPSKP